MENTITNNSMSVINKQAMALKTKYLSESEFYRHEVYPIIIARLMMMGIDINLWVYQEVTTGLSHYRNQNFVDGYFISRYEELKNIRLKISLHHDKNNKWSVENIDIYNFMEPSMF